MTLSSTRYHNEMYNLNIHKFFNRIATGWWWFSVCWEEWLYCMVNPENTGGDFFCHLSSDYCKYEELTGEHALRKQETAKLIEKLTSWFK